MKKILVLTEKKFITNIIKKALLDELDHIDIAEIGGYVYFEDVDIYLDVSKEELYKSKKVKINDKEGYLLGEEVFLSNLKKIEEMLLTNDYDYIINACDNDINGDSLFELANKTLNISSDKIKRLRYSLLESDHIKQKYNELIKNKMVD